MKIFTGSKKKSIAGISCALVIFLFSTLTFADEIAAANTKPIANTQAAVSSSTNAQTNESVNAANNNIPAASATQTTAPKSITPPIKNSSTTSQLASVVGGLVVILLLIYALSWFVKRFSQGGFMQNASMKIVSSMPLGTRERLMLVDVGGKQLLLGVTATAINTLHVFDEPVVQTEKAQAATSDFSQKLMAILQQKNLTPNDNDQKKSNW